MDLAALSNGLHGSVQMDSVALFLWIGWLRHHGILTITNFLSFRDEVILSLSTDKDNLLLYKNEGILTSVAVYGANATSKSNLLC